TILFIPRIPVPSRASRVSGPKVLVCPDCGTPTDTDSTTCTGCGRVIEWPAAAPRPELAAPPQVLSPTAAGAWLVLAVLLVVVVGGPIYWWRSQLAQVPGPESEIQLKSRLQSEAQFEMLKESTNVVVGLNRIIHVSVTNDDDNTYKWAGEVVAEFVNRV